MIISEQYIIEIKAKLFSSTVIQSVTIISERILSDSGYFRARLILSNGDFLEIVEYFIVQNNSCITVTYRYQWMDGIRENLRKRWDNVEHFPDLPNFPHHVHIGA
jgi:Family of unknown function (DUF6516)